MSGAEGAREREGPALSSPTLQTSASTTMPPLLHFTRKYAVVPWLPEPLQTPGTLGAHFLGVHTPSARGLFLRSALPREEAIWGGLQDKAGGGGMNQQVRERGQGPESSPSLKPALKPAVSGLGQALFSLSFSFLGSTGQGIPSHGDATG